MRDNEIVERIKKQADISKDLESPVGPDPEGEGPPKLFCNCSRLETPAPLKRVQESSVFNPETFSGDCPNCGKMWDVSEMLS